MSELHGLRCKTVALVEPDHYRKIRFFQCSVCHRRYALELGRALTLQWREPVTLALYEVYAYRAPVEYAGKIAQRFITGYSREELDWIVREIRLELDDPTHQVRDTLDCTASEVELRRYLTAFCDCMERLQPGG